MSLIIGSIIGLVMGLTGAGGALVAIPLFMHFLEMSIKEASFYSLIAVVLASLSNFFYQRKSANFLLALKFIIFSTIGSYLSLPYKNFLPDLLISILLLIIGFYSLYSIWRTPDEEDTSNVQKTHFLKTLFIGFFLGVITTFTGLGGGVLMFPILVNFYKLKNKEAVATSLLVVGLSSLTSFLIQALNSFQFKFSNDFWALGIGILLIPSLLKILLIKLPEKTINFLRKTTFTLVVFTVFFTL